MSSSVDKLISRLVKLATDIPFSSRAQRAMDAYDPTGSRKGVSRRDSGDELTTAGQKLTRSMATGATPDMNRFIREHDIRQHPTREEMTGLYPPMGEMPTIFPADAPSYTAGGRMLNLADTAKVMRRRMEAARPGPMGIAKRDAAIRRRALADSKTAKSVAQAQKGPQRATGLMNSLRDLLGSMAETSYHDYV